MKVIEEEQRVQVMEGQWTAEAVIKSIVEEGGHDEPFYVMDLGEVVARYHHWKELMPRVEPFYGELHLKKQIRYYKKEMDGLRDCVT